MCVCVCMGWVKVFEYSLIELNLGIPNFGDALFFSRKSMTFFPQKNVYTYRLILFVQVA